MFKSLELYKLLKINATYVLNKCFYYLNIVIHSYKSSISLLNSVHNVFEGWDMAAAPLPSNRIQVDA